RRRRNGPGLDPHRARLPPRPPGGGGRRPRRRRRPRGRGGGPRGATRGRGDRDRRGHRRAAGGGRGHHRRHHPRRPPCRDLRRPARRAAGAGGEAMRGDPRRGGVPGRARRDTGELFMVSQSRRHNPHLRETRRLADQLGGAGIVDTRFHRAPRFGGFREAMDHPLIVDMAIHAFDAGRVLIDGNPVSVRASSYNPPWSWYAGDAAATVTIAYDTGAVHTYSGSWCAPGRETSWNGEWSLSCPQGSVHWDGEASPTAQPEGAQEIIGRRPDGTDLWELEASLAEFCAALHTGTTTDSEVHSNVWTQAIVEAAVRAADTGRQVQLSEVLDAALEAARQLDSADGRSSALATWKTGSSGLTAQ